MFSSESLNASSGTKELINTSNHTNISEILLKLNKNNLSFQYPNTVRLFTVGLIVFISGTAHLFATGQLACINRLSSCVFRKMEMWICTVHMLFIGILVGFVTLAQVSFESDEGMFYCLDACQLVNNLRIYFLTLSSYMLVILVLNCYSIVVKPLFSTPIRFSKLVSSGILFYTLCSIPAIIMATLQHFSNHEPVCIPYHFATMQFSGFSEKIGLVLVLFSTYIVPLCLIVGVFIRIINSLQAKSSQSKEPLSSPSDANFVRMTSMMSLAFIISNTPLIIQELIIIFFDSNLVNPNLLIFVEICSIMNISINPYIYLWINCKSSHFSVTEDTISNNNERGHYKCCYEPVLNDVNKVCLIKPILAIPAKE